MYKYNTENLLFHLHLLKIQLDLSIPQEHDNRIFFNNLQSHRKY